MNREPTSFYIVRLLCVGLILFFLGMLYWSSLALEERMRDISFALKDLKSDVRDLKSRPQTVFFDKEQKEVSNKLRPHIDKNLPNLLVDDPFYAKTLPEMLGKDFVPHGEMRAATLVRPNDLHPFSNFSEVASWQRRCSVGLANLAFGKYDEMVPNLAIKIEARQIPGYDDPDAVEFWVHLRDDIYWQPLEARLFPGNVTLAPIFLEKHQVTAEDVAFYFDAMSNLNVEEGDAVAARNYYSDIEKLEVIDPQTLVVRWKVHEFTDVDGKKVNKINYRARNLTAGLSPLPRFVYQRFMDGSKILEDDSAPDAYRTSNIWARNFSQHWARNIIVSCGAWIFDGMTEREISFRRNDEYPYPLAALTKKYTVEFKETPEAIWQSFKSDKLDTYNLQPNQLSELDEFVASQQYNDLKARGSGISRLDYLARIYAFIGWNQANPLFASKGVRQALTMAIDRTRIVEQNLNGMGVEITGPFYRYSTSYDESITPWPYDLQRARQLLEKEGWYDSDNDGIIDKEIDGRRVPFSFALTYYTKNPTAKSISEYVATNLKQLGIACSLKALDIADISQAFDDKSFDALFFGWALGTPPEDPKQIWYSAGAHEKGSSNAIGFVNAEADKIIDALTYESNPEERKKLYYRFDAIMHEEAPYTFLYSPKIVYLYHDYIQNVFIPKDRQDLVPGANTAEPDSAAFWIKK